VDGVAPTLILDLLHLPGVDHLLRGSAKGEKTETSIRMIVDVTENVRGSRHLQDRFPESALIIEMTEGGNRHRNETMEAGEVALDTTGRGRGNAIEAAMRAFHPHLVQGLRLLKDDGVMRLMGMIGIGIGTGSVRGAPHRLPVIEALGRIGLPNVEQAEVDVFARCHTLRLLHRLLLEEMGE